MKIFRASLFLALAGSTVLTACGASMSVISHEKQAYVVKQNMGGSDMYFCSVATGKPVCAPVTESD